MITQEADVSRQTFYRHFKTKDDIIYYCLDSLSADLIQRLHNRTDASVRDILLAYFPFWRDNVEILTLVYSGRIEHVLVRHYNELMMCELNVLRPYYTPLSDRDFTLFKSFLIIGERGDSRPVERSAAWLFDRTFSRRLSRFQPSDGKQIATVMIEKAQLPIPNQPTVYRYHPQEFQAPRTR